MPKTIDMQAPSYIPIAWLNNEPCRYVALRDCSGEQLKNAMHYADPAEFETLKVLLRTFIQRGGRDEDLLGVVLRLPRQRGLAPYIANKSDPDDRRYAGRRSLIYGN